MFLAPGVDRNTHARVYMHAGRSQRPESGFFRFVSPRCLIITIFETGLSYCTWDLPNQLGWLAAESCLPPPRTVGASDVHTLPGFLCQCWDSKPRSLGFCSKHFAHGPIPPVLPRLLFLPSIISSSSFTPSFPPSFPPKQAICEGDKFSSY